MNEMCKALNRYAAKFMVDFTGFRLRATDYNAGLIHLKTAAILKR